jgi:hypothetical protein
MCRCLWSNSLLGISPRVKASFSTEKQKHVKPAFLMWKHLVMYFSSLHYYSFTFKKSRESEFLQHLTDQSPAKHKSWWAKGVHSRHGLPAAPPTLLTSEILAVPSGASAEPNCTWELCALSLNTHPTVPASISSPGSFSDYVTMQTFWSDWHSNTRGQTIWQKSQIPPVPHSQGTIFLAALEAGWGFEARYYLSSWCLSPHICLWGMSGSSWLREDSIMALSYHFYCR